MVIKAVTAQIFTTRISPHMAGIAYDFPLGTSAIVPFKLWHGMGLFHVLLSILSHCTMWDRMGLSQAYHPPNLLPAVPLYMVQWDGMGRDGMGRHGTIPSVPSPSHAPCCPSRPIVPCGTGWDGMGLPQPNPLLDQMCVSGALKL